MYIVALQSLTPSFLPSPALPVSPSVTLAPTLTGVPSPPPVPVVPTVSPIIPSPPPVPVVYEAPIVPEAPVVPEAVPEVPLDSVLPEIPLVPVVPLVSSVPSDPSLAGSMVLPAPELLLATADPSSLSPDSQTPAPHPAQADPFEHQLSTLILQPHPQLHIKQHLKVQFHPQGKTWKGKERRHWALICMGS